jgi:hypothetical protein
VVRAEEDPAELCLPAFLRPDQHRGGSGDAARLEDTGNGSDQIPGQIPPGDGVFMDAEG